MRRTTTARALRDMLREQLYCVGRVAARHRLPDDAVWELVKGFEVLHQRAPERTNGFAKRLADASAGRHATPHSGITYLLNKLDGEDSVRTRVARTRMRES